MRAKAGLLHLTKDKPCNNLAYIESSVSVVVALCAVRMENEGFGPARRRLTNSIMQWQMVQNSGHISLPILSGSMVQTLGANSSKTWHVMLVLQRTLNKILWRRWGADLDGVYNVLSAQDLVQNMAYHAGASPARHAMLRLLLAYCPTEMAGL